MGCRSIRLNGFLQYAVYQEERFRLFPVLNHNFLTSVRGADFDSNQLIRWQIRIPAPTFLESAICCYSCCVWRCFLDEGCESRGAQQLLTEGILHHSGPLMRLFSLLLPFVVSLFFLPRFCSAAPSVCPALVKPVLHIHGALCLDTHPLHSPFSLQNNGMRCKSESIHPGFLDVCQTAPEQQHDLFCAQISTVYTLLALLREGSKGRDRRGENILSIYRILAARHHFILPMM